MSFWWPAVYIAVAGILHGMCRYVTRTAVCVWIRLVVRPVRRLGWRTVMDLAAIRSVLGYIILSIHSFIHSLIHSFIHSFVHSFIHSFIHFWHAPLWVRSAKRKHQSPEWTILSHVNCFIQGEVHWFQVLLGSLHPRSTGASRWSPPVLQGGAVKICLASDSSVIRTR